MSDGKVRYEEVKEGFGQINEGSTAEVSSDHFYGLYTAGGFVRSLLWAPQLPSYLRLYLRLLFIAVFKKRNKER
jgi:hypothetical protein